MRSTRDRLAPIRRSRRSTPWLCISSPLLDAAAGAPAGAAYRAAAAQLEDGFRLEGWSIDLQPARPVLWVEYAVPTSAKVAVTVIAGSRPTEAGRYPQWHYLGQSDPQRTVRAVQPGEIYRVEVPLERYTPGEPEAFVLTFELESGLSSGVFVKKIYATYPIHVLGQRSLRLPPPRGVKAD